jgi:hypothetical protein
MKLEWAKSGMIDGSCLGDGPPAFQDFFNSPFNILLNQKVLSRLTPNAFKFAELFTVAKTPGFSEMQQTRRYL